jgi:hypothetical protein
VATDVAEAKELVVTKAAAEAKQLTAEEAGRDDLLLLLLFAQMRQLYFMLYLLYIPVAKAGTCLDTCNIGLLCLLVVCCHFTFPIFFLVVIHSHSLIFTVFNYPFPIFYEVSHTTCFYGIQLRTHIS